MGFSLKGMLKREESLTKQQLVAVADMEKNTKMVIQEIERCIMMAEQRRAGRSLETKDIMRILMVVNRQVQTARKDEKQIGRVAKLLMQQMKKQMGGRRLVAEEKRIFEDIRKIDRYFNNVVVQIKGLNGHLGRMNYVSDWGNVINGLKAIDKECRAIIGFAADIRKLENMIFGQLVRAEKGKI